MVLRWVAGIPLRSRASDLVGKGRPGTKRQGAKVEAPDLAKDTLGTVNGIAENRNRWGLAQVPRPQCSASVKFGREPLRN